MSNVSVFRSMGIGYAISNVTLMEDKLEVYLPEMSPDGHGKIDPFQEVLEVDTLDSQGNLSKIKIKTTNSIECEWMPGAGWLRKAPSIRRGERVEVFTIADTGRFWWRELGLDANLRRLDTIIIAISNKRFELNEDPELELDFENTYFMEFSTHSKQVRIVTTDTDEEPYSYNIGLDTREGIFNINDSINNFIRLESQKRKITVSNASKSKLTIEENKIDVEINEGSNLHLEDDEFTFTSGNGDIITSTDDNIEFKNKTGSSVLIKEDMIDATNSTGSHVNINENSISMSNTAGSSVDIVDGSITAIAGDGAAMAIGAGISASAGGASLSMDGGSASLDAGGGGIELSGGNVIIKGTLIQLN